MQMRPMKSAVNKGRNFTLKNKHNERVAVTGCSFLLGEVLM